MKNKLPAILIILLLLIAFFANKYVGKTQNEDGLQFADYSSIQYSAHAKCRMDCRNIDKSEIKEILKEGRLNESKTRKSSKGISYAVEGWSHDEQHVRVVCSPHGNTLVIVTVIDLENDWSCNCN